MGEKISPKFFSREGFLKWYNLLPNKIDELIFPIHTYGLVLDGSINDVQSTVHFKVEAVGDLVCVS